jgi:hypothetical protein
MRCNEYRGNASNRNEAKGARPFRIHCRDGKVKSGWCGGRTQFSCPRGANRAEAVVRHAKSGGLGLKFLAMGKEDQKRLKALITRLRK